MHVSLIHTQRKRQAVYMHSIVGSRTHATHCALADSYTRFTLLLENQVAVMFKPVSTSSTKPEYYINICYSLNIVIVTLALTVKNACVLMPINLLKILN